MARVAASRAAINPGTADDSAGNPATRRASRRAGGFASLPYGSFANVETHKPLLGTPGCSRMRVLWRDGCGKPDISQRRNDERTRTTEGRACSQQHRTVVTTMRVFEHDAERHMSCNVERSIVGLRLKIPMRVRRRSELRPLAMEVDFCACHREREPTLTTRPRPR